MPRETSRMSRIALIAAALLCFVVSGCTGALEGRQVPSGSVLSSPSPWPTPRIVRGGPPRILAFWMNESDIRNGTDWIGRAVATTNVASLEIRTESFSFVAERTDFGAFRFRQHVLDWVPQYKRAYTLQVIARNAAGDRDTLLVPISFK